jgi:hypothetical protein
MSATVDGPDPTAFKFPNELEIHKLNHQIKLYKDAKEKADGHQKKHLIERQIEQLEEHRKILKAEILHIP